MNLSSLVRDTQGFPGSKASFGWPSDMVTSSIHPFKIRVFYSQGYRINGHDAFYDVIKALTVLSEIHKCMLVYCPYLERWEEREIEMIRIEYDSKSHLEINQVLL